MARKILATAVEGIVLLLVVVWVIGFKHNPPQASPSATNSKTLSVNEDPFAWEKDLKVPTQSDRIVHYKMNVKLDTATNIISGWEELTWRNTSGRALDEFPFHLYHNAWKNTLSTFAREAGGEFGRPNMKASDYGYTNVKSIKILPDGYYQETDIKNTFKYIQPDDNNHDDQTVFQVTAPKPVPDGKSITFRIEFETKQPLPIARTGAIRNYHFVAQWFPKIGVWWKGAWNCHQFHRTSEFFADYGVYDVSITVPSRYIVGATGGEPVTTKENEDGTKTLTFHQEDVHDFAWTAFPDFIRVVRTFSHTTLEPGENPRYHHPLKEVKVILLLQPHHRILEERYFNAVFKTLQYYGEWYGEYPYDYLTVVDPANDSRSGGMEYPTLFTGGTNYFSPIEASSPEGVTVHECGHQWWYGMVGNNEFEEAWLDEGFNTYSTDKVLNTGWKPFHAVRYFFGGVGAGTSVGIPLVSQEGTYGRETGSNTLLRSLGKNDSMARKAWEYDNSYRINAYTKPALSLYTLERYLGEDLMYRVMRTYHYQYRFKHPTSKDFINTVNEVVGKDMTWFFNQTWYSSNLFDYSIEEVSSQLKQPGKGIFNFNGQVSSDSSIASGAERRDSIYVSEVVVKREGEAVFPVEVLVVFQNGEEVREQWDGQYRWIRYHYEKPTKLKYAIVDPDMKLPMDVNYNNNSKVLREPDFRSLAARKLTSKWMFFVQHFLELVSFLN
jgi:hypothetical protein